MKYKGGYYDGWWDDASDDLYSVFKEICVEALMAKTGPLDADTIREKPTLERKREWQHGLEGKGKDCDRYNKPVYTPPEKVPDTCHDWNCDNTEYQSKGIVTRNKATKEIVDREDKR